MTIALMTNGYILPPKVAPVITLVGPGVETIHNIIRCKIEDVLRPLINCPVQYDNAPFKKPDKACWLRATIVLGDARQVDIGAKLRRFRYTGVLMFNIFTPLVQGDLEGNKIADQITLVFRAVNISGITFRVPNSALRRRIDAEWMHKVNCPFFVDQLG